MKHDPNEPILNNTVPKEEPLMIAPIIHKLTGKDASSNMEVSLIMPLFKPMANQEKEGKKGEDGTVEGDDGSLYSAEWRGFRKLLFVLCNVIALICYITFIGFYDVVGYVFAYWLPVVSVLCLWGFVGFFKRLDCLKWRLVALAYIIIFILLSVNDWWYGPVVFPLELWRIALLLWFIVAKIPKMANIVRKIMVLLDRWLPFD